MTSYIYSWGPRFTCPGLHTMARKGERCVVVVRGAMNSALVRFADGYEAVVSRNALRRAR